MRKMCRVFLFAIMSFSFSFAQNANVIPSPSAFLGYPLGSKYSFHHKVVSYFETVAKASPATIKMQSYGKTYEGRPLMVLYISSPENISNLENIRLNNLRLAGILNDQPANERTPAIVWLSYNVHGNETSSSEAAMKTLYALADPQNPKTKEWLKNIVVVMDPCINPDGRDRYVNWFNTVASVTPDPELQAREHHEPWPGGRSNHYNFDLNRDWAWQSQIETAQRLQLYNQWLPQVHVDFHEQGFNEPYYFAPAAEPFHDVITVWQRDFQKMIGRNHAKYFDANGWLFFTKERFDLFYPSYGDTYPTYSGAIGMTFEQGGIRSGLAVINEDGDTLKLSDRLEHHYTTGMSTIEISSTNSERLVKEFRKFYDDGVRNVNGDFKSYVIRHEANRPAIESGLLRFLQSHGIRYQYAPSKKMSKLYSYLNRKEDNFNIEAGDIVIQSAQPKSALLRVLFEPQSRITDTITYDITAWSIPYAWGLEAYASKEKLLAVNESPVVPVLDAKQITAQPVGYVIPWNCFADAKMLSAILQQNIKVRVADLPFRIDGRDYEKGSLLVLKTSNSSFGDALENILYNTAKKIGYPAIIRPVYSGFVDKGADFGSSSVRSIKKPKVAMLTGEGVNANAAGEIWHYFEQQLQYPISLINLSYATQFRWTDYDVVIMPDGNFRFIFDKPAQEMIRQWIMQGGRLIALEGAAEQLADLDWGLKLKKEDDKKDKDKEVKNDDDLLRKYENRERDNLRKNIPGAIYKVEVDNSHPLAFGYPSYYYTLKRDDNVYEYLQSGWNVGVIKDDAYVTGFAGHKTKEKLKNGSLFGVKPMGKGNIIFMADDPVFRSFWENGKLLLANAVFIVP
ncbi:MAG: M14 family metallopeptidase [Chitinophagaceae bacterium]